MLRHEFYLYADHKPVCLSRLQDAAMKGIALADVSAAGAGVWQQQKYRTPIAYNCSLLPKIKQNSAHEKMLAQAKTYGLDVSECRSRVIQTRW